MSRDTHSAPARWHVGEEQGDGAEIELSEEDWEDITEPYLRRPPELSPELADEDAEGAPRHP